jgi:hypothetical protein
MTANRRQVGGSHYKADGTGEEHWDRVHRLKLDYFQAAITKYVERCWKKNGVEDLRKAQHFLEKYIELNVAAPLPAAAPPALPAPPAATDARLVDMAHVNPAGLTGYVFEGFDAAGALYTCRGCGVKVRCPVGHWPGHSHICEGAEPGAGYVDQG